AATQNNDSGSSGVSLRLLHGHVYSGVETLGKELFLYFGPKALRIHFGMKGYVRINPLEYKNKNGISPVLEVQLSKDLICFFDSSVELRDSMESQQRIRMMEELDVCSPKFNFSRAEREVRKQQGRMLCDVLMDQRVLPGVGNIIKNEALFDSGLHPAVRVCQLTEEQIQHLVKMTRDFSLLFYRCRKAGLAVSKHYKVYGRPHCGRCRSRITVCRLGENSRMTYFCPHCQSEDARRADRGEPQMDTTDGACAPLAPVPRCSQHRRLCVLRVVSKGGENKGRPFYTCPLPREAQCGFFEWADLSFPFCNHGKRSILRTVLKMGPNNGKKFFVCPLGKETQCSFFQWAALGRE
ncbi:Endonuclease 8-like 3, partial [Myotis brandtii]